MWGFEDIFLKKNSKNEITKLRMCLGYGGESNKAEVTWVEWEKGGCEEMSSERETGGRSGRASQTVCGGLGNVPLRSLAARTFFTDSSSAALLYSPLLAQIPRSLPMTETVGVPFESICGMWGFFSGKFWFKDSPSIWSKLSQNSIEIWNLDLSCSPL